MGWELARMASASHGVVTRAQLLRAGITRAEIEQRLRNGTLLREHRGVYRVGHRAPSREARYLSAVLAGGPGALLSGKAAAHLWGIGGGAPPPPEVTTPTERRLAGVVTCRARRQAGPRNSLPRDAIAYDAAVREGIPVTSVARTLVDLAAVLGEAALARACHEAGIRHGTTPAQIEAVLVRRPTSPGAGRLRAIVRGDVRVTLSVLEDRFLGRLRDAGLHSRRRTAGWAAGASTAVGPTGG